MRASERMALTLVAMAVVSLLVGKAISSELSVATEARRDFTVHSHDKKVKIQKVSPTSSLLKILAFDISCFPTPKMAKLRLFVDVNSQGFEVKITKRCSLVRSL